VPPDVRNALAGLLLAAGAFALFGWNEHRIVDRENALEALLDSAIPVRGDAIDDGLEGKLVLVQGPLRGSGPLRDGKVPYEATAVRLRRTVQMYQWETRVEKREETAPDGTKRTVESEIFTRVARVATLWEIQQRSQGETHQRGWPKIRIAETLDGGCSRPPSLRPSFA